MNLTLFKELDNQAIIPEETDEKLKEALTQLIPSRQKRFFYKMYYLSKNDQSEIKGDDKIVKLYNDIIEFGEGCECNLLFRNAKRLSSSEEKSLRDSLSSAIRKKYKVAEEVYSPKYKQTKTENRTKYDISGKLRTFKGHYLYEEAYPNPFGEKAIIVLEKIKIKKLK